MVPRLRDHWTISQGLTDACIVLSLLLFHHHYLSAINTTAVHTHMTNTDMFNIDMPDDERADTDMTDTDIAETPTFLDLLGFGPVADALALHVSYLQSESLPQTCSTHQRLSYGKPISCASLRRLCCHSRELVTKLSSGLHRMFTAMST